MDKVNSLQNVDEKSQGGSNQHEERVDLELVSENSLDGEVHQHSSQHPDKQYWQHSTHDLC